MIFLILLIKDGGLNRTHSGPHPSKAYSCMLWMNMDVAIFFFFSFDKYMDVTYQKIKKKYMDVAILQVI